MSRTKNNILVCALFAGLIGVAGCATSDQATSNQAKDTTSGTTAKTEATNAPTPARGTAIGDIAPDFQLTQTNGTPVSLDSLRGQPAVVVFWTAWCPFCKEEAPHINELAAQYEAKGVRVLGIDIQDSEARTAGGIKEFGIKYAVARDADAKIAKLYKVQGTPTVLFLDKDGLIRYTGNELPKDYAAQLDKLL